MKERPILFSPPMIRAIFLGTKTQTRRAVKGEPLEFLAQFPPAFIARSDNYFSPYGYPGDRLWVKEAWRVPMSLDDKSPIQIADECLDAGYCKPWAPVEYVADKRRNNDAWWKAWKTTHGNDQAGRYRHARFMPRWASRITLEVIDVRVERLHDISTNDCLAEGLDPTTPPHLARQAYRDVWNETTGNWEGNPWIWAITFKPVDTQEKSRRLG